MSFHDSNPEVVDHIFINMVYFEKQLCVCWGGGGMNKRPRGLDHPLELKTQYSDKNVLKSFR